MFCFYFTFVLVFRFEKKLYIWSYYAEWCKLVFILFLFFLSKNIKYFSINTTLTLSAYAISSKCQGVVAGTLNPLTIHLKFITFFQSFYLQHSVVCVVVFFFLWCFARQNLWNYILIRFLTRQRQGRVKCYKVFFFGFWNSSSWS